MSSASAFLERVRSRSGMRRWKPKQPLLRRYAVLAQQGSDSKNSPWELWQTSSVDDSHIAGVGRNLHGIYLNMEDFTWKEQIELGELLNVGAKRRTPEQQLREHELLSRAKRIGQMPGCYDLDFKAPEDSAKAADLIRAEELRRGIALRECWSGGAVRGKRHLEWGPLELPGHVNALRAALGRACDVLHAIGFVPRVDEGHKDPRFWCFPEDPAGTRGMVDVSNLHRDPASRGAMLRTLGGLHKDGKNRKELIPGSPDVGSTFTLAMVEEGLKLADKHYPQEAPLFVGGPARTKLPDLPSDDREQYIEESFKVVQTMWREGRGHPLRMALGGTLIRSGLLSLTSVEELLRATTAFGVDENGQPFDTRHDARSTTVNTAVRLKSGLKVSGSNSLRKIVGTRAVFELAWALHLDLHRPLAWIWEKITTKQRATEAEVEKERQWLLDQADSVDSMDIKDTEKAELRDRLLKMRHRLMASTICMKARQYVGRCPIPNCNKVRCRKHMECGDPSCNACTIRRVWDVIENMTLPKFCTVVHRNDFKTKAEAMKAVRKLPKMGKKRPRPMYAITPTGLWECTLLYDEADRYSLLTAASFGGDIYKHQESCQVLNWIARCLLMKHVTARHALEKGDESAMKLLVECYRKHTTSGNNLAVMWPTKAQIREMRKQQAKHRHKTAEELAEECQHTEEERKDFPTVYEVINVRTGEVVIDDLERPPTLAQVAAHEAGEPARLGKRRRFGGRRRE